MKSRVKRFIGKAVRRTGAPGYAVYTKAAVARRALCFTLRREAPLIVYSMGKVGSVTVTEALKRACPGAPVYHVHTLRREMLSRKLKVYRDHFRKQGRVHRNLLDSLFLHGRLQNEGENGATKWRVVSLVREPLARNISAFFQVLGRNRPGLEFVKRIREGGDPGLVDEMIAHFTTRNDQRRPAEWFDRELKETFGIDVLGEGFARERGYAVYRGARADALVIRLENLDACAAAAFEEAWAISGLRLIRQQDAATKFYADVYRSFLARARFPAAFLDRIYDTLSCRTFYTDTEIASFRARWEMKA